MSSLILCKDVIKLDKNEPTKALYLRKLELILFFKNVSVLFEQNYFKVIYEREFC